MPRIECRVSKKGEVKIETSGYTGPACALATESAIAALRGQAAVEHKDEFYAVNVQEQSQQVSN